jgi:hypothetical protein
LKSIAAATSEDPSIKNMRTQWHSCNAPEAARNLSMIPFLWKHNLDNTDFGLHLATHCGISLEELKPSTFKGLTACPLCKHAVRVEEGFTRHALVCGRVLPNDAEDRHKEVMLELMSAGGKWHRVASEVWLSSLAQLPNGQQHRADVVVYSGDSITKIIDVVITAPRAAGEEKPGAAAERAAAAKLSHYKPYKGKAGIVPFALEAWGRWGDEAKMLVKGWAEAGCTPPFHKDPRYARALDKVHANVSAILARYRGRLLRRYMRAVHQSMGLELTTPEDVQHKKRKQALRARGHWQPGATETSPAAAGSAAPAAIRATAPGGAATDE